MPLFTTTPIRIMMPIIAMKENVVPVAAKNRNTPKIENTIEPRIIEKGSNKDSNNAAMTRNMQAIPNRIFVSIMDCVSSEFSNPRPNFQL